MDKKSRRPKRLLLDKDIVKLLTTSTMQLVRAGFIVWPTSAPPDECSAVWLCG